MLDRRTFLTTTSAVAAALSHRPITPLGPVLRPEDFGARGNAESNDTEAFSLLSAELNRRGGGTIWLGRGRTYLVGKQARGGEFGWTPSPIIEIHGLSAPLEIIGNGARLLCQPQLRFGTFDRHTGERVQRAMPNYRKEEIATPYRAMISISDCVAPIAIRDIELDGNIQRLLIGGERGDTGWQIPGSGLLLIGNLGPELVEHVLTHHHGQDGAMIIGNSNRSARSRFSHFLSRYNVRQGLSLTAGRGYDFEDCEFSHTGRSKISSAPGAGIDIEAEDKPVRDLTFARCRFLDNAGAGLLADSGDSEDARFTGCIFVGTTTWSAWPKKPHFRFTGCTFVGAVAHPFPDANYPDRAARFIDCRFTDDPKLSPTRKVYAGNNGSGPIVNMSESENVLFDRCIFNVMNAALPWSWKAIYRDCTMSQRSKTISETKGKFLGRTTIQGQVDLYGSMVIGTLIVNERLESPGPKGVASW